MGTKMSWSTAFVGAVAVFSALVLPAQTAAASNSHHATESTAAVHQRRMIARVERQQVSTLDRRLQLTTTQRAKLERILAGVHRRVMALQKNRSLTSAQKRQDVISLESRSRARFVATLTPEQKERFEALRRERHRKLAKMVRR